MWQEERERGRESHAGVDHAKACRFSAICGIINTLAPLSPFTLSLISSFGNSFSHFFSQFWASFRMGRGKIEIKKIENVNSRQVTFSKRRAGLFKKANELAVLCEAEVAVIIFSNTGKLFEFANSSMKRILSRYKKCVDTTKGFVGGEPEPEKPQPKEVDVLKEEIEKLKLKQQRLLGKDLTGMSSQELHLLEQQLNEGLVGIKERKEQLLLQELKQCRMQEQRAVLENETLRRQVEELRGVFPPTRSPTPICINYNPSLVKSDPAAKEGSGSLETACNGGLADEDSDTTLQLGLPYGNSRKRKTPDRETHSSTSETHFRL